MQPGYPGPGQDPYGQQQPQYNDPYGQPQYPQQPQYTDPYAQPQPQYQDPYAQPPTSGSPYPGSPPPYPGSPPPYPGSPPPYPGSPPPYPGSPQAYPGSPQAYQYPVAGYGAPPPQATGQNNTLGILALIFGILAIPSGICCSLLALLPGGAGVVLGMLGMRKANEGQASNRGMALTGVICGGIGAVLGIAMFVLSLVFNFSSVRYP
jgi:hypothetical protein